MRLQMWTRNVLIASAIAGASTGMLRAQAQTAWPAIPDEDLALKDNPAKPGSSAMILIKKESRDDIKKTWETFYRIKIFTENGRDYGDIQIPYVPKAVEVSEISARVVQSDGRSTEFRGAIYDKTLARRQKVRVMAKTFTLPDVKPGVIIDYRFLMKSKADSPAPGPWTIQEKLFIRKAEIEWRPITEGLLWQAFARSMPPSGDLVNDRERNQARNTHRYCGI